MYRLNFNVVITTNNGAEAQNKVLKHKYLNSNQGKEDTFDYLDFCPSTKISTKATTRVQQACDAIIIVIQGV